MHCTAIECEGRYPDRFQFRAPLGFRGAIKTAADKRFTSPAEWARQTLLRGLEAEGIRVVSGGNVDADDR